VADAAQPPRAQDVARITAAAELYMGTEFEVCPISRDPKCQRRRARAEVNVAHAREIPTRASDHNALEALLAPPFGTMPAGKSDVREFPQHRRRTNFHSGVSAFNATIEGYGLGTTSADQTGALKTDKMEELQRDMVRVSLMPGRLGKPSGNTTLAENHTDENKLSKNTTRILSKTILGHILPFLGIEEVVALQLLNQEWRDAISNVYLRLDQKSGPMSLPRLKRYFGSSGQWKISGVRVLDALPGNDLYHIFPPESIEFLQLSCLYGPRNQDKMDLSRFRALHVLELDELVNLSNLSALAACRDTLSSLTLRGCSSLQDVTMLRELPKLERLVLQDCRLLQDVSALASCETITELTLSGMDHIDLDAREHFLPLVALRSLQITRCANIANLDGIQELPKLEELVVRYHPMLTCLPANFGEAQALRTLVVSSCRKFTDISGLGLCSSLVQLDLSNTAVSSKALSEIRPCVNLVALDIALCNSITYLNPIESLSQLERLSLWGCESLHSLRPLASCRNLHTVDLSTAKVSMGDHRRALAHVRLVLCDVTNTLFSHRYKVLHPR